MWCNTTQFILERCRVGKITITTRRCIPADHNGVDSLWRVSGGHVNDQQRFPVFAQHIPERFSTPASCKYMRSTTCAVCLLLIVIVRPEIIHAMAGRFQTSRE